jgi:hypothetical protein
MFMTWYGRGDPRTPNSGGLGEYLIVSIRFSPYSGQ